MSGYIKFTGIEGEELDKNHKNWIRITHVSQSVTRPVEIGGVNAGKKGAVQCGDILVSKQVDKSTPKLVGAVCKGTKFDEVIIDLTADVGQNESMTFMQWKLKNAYVSSYSVGGMAGDGMGPTENLNLSYEKIEWIYTPVDEKGKPGGAIPQTWDVAARTE